MDRGDTAPSLHRYRGRSLDRDDRVITKAVGFDNSLRDDETEVQNELNDLIAQILFESLSHDQFIALINSHNTDR
jgi:hypothetical protein